MDLVSSAESPAFADADLAAVVSQLRSPGVRLDVGAVAVHVRSDNRLLAAHLQRAYAHFPLQAASGWADVHAEVAPGVGLRRWFRQQARLVADGRKPFEPFPADSALPMLEWGCNWLIGQRMHHVLLLHAGVVERDGLALVMPAVPGSGKSTLTAALSHRGWRLLSDEFGALEPETLTFRAVLKPVALKNTSIEVLRAFAPQACFGPEFPRTRKGRVVHMAAPADAVARRGVAARPGAFVLPRWQAGSATVLQPLQPDHLFSALAYNAFNYGVLGGVSFQAVVALVHRCPAWSLVYSDLDEAVAALQARWPEVVARQAGAAA